MSNLWPTASPYNINFYQVPGVKLRPAHSTTHKEDRTPDSTWTHSSGLDSDDETTHLDVCPRPFKSFVLCATGINDKVSIQSYLCSLPLLSIVPSPPLPPFGSRWTA